MFTWDEGDLNSEQENAIREDGSVFLVACPGSGKTRTLTYKIAYELSKLQSNRQFVLAITYTNRAADEIHERIENLGVDTSQLWIGTIHAFCLEWILRPYGIYHKKLSRGFRVIDSHEGEQILEELCKPYTQPNVTHWDCGFHFTDEKCVIACQQDNKRDAVCTILKEYFRILRNNQQIDFELILYYAYQIIASRPSISRILSQLFSFILVDEYQDTKKIQYLIIAAILQKGAGRTKTFIVGDPNQAIYQSLGGYPIDADDFQNMAGITLKKISLSKNYRSSEKIINYFGNYNVHNTNIEAASHNKNYLSLISHNNAINKSSLADELVKLIKFNIETVQVPPHEICILAPQWPLLASMTRKLVSAMPEYQFDGPGVVPFARDIENFWYKLSKIALTQASIGLYVRRLRWAAEVLKDMDAAGVDVSKLTKKLLLRECNAIEIHETEGLPYLRAFFDALFGRLKISFDSFEMLREHHKAFFDSSKARIDRLKGEGADFISDLKTFKKVFQNRTGITVSTIHGVKGAEYDVVIAFGLLQGMVPHFNDEKQDDRGEGSAKRLLYVLSSRARKNLYLISEQGREGKKPTSALVGPDTH